MPPRPREAARDDATGRKRDPARRARQSDFRRPGMRQPVLDVMHRAALGVRLWRIEIGNGLERISEGQNHLMRVSQLVGGRGDLQRIAQHDDAESGDRQRAKTDDCEGGTYMSPPSERPMPSAITVLPFPGGP